MERKKIIWLSAALAVAVLCLVCISVMWICMAIGTVKSRADAAENADISNIVAVEVKDSEPIYFLRELDGRIGIFSEDNVLIETLDVSVMTLPKTDRESLREGIAVRGTENLNSLKEDYTG